MGRRRGLLSTLIQIERAGRRAQAAQARAALRAQRQAQRAGDRRRVAEAKEQKRIYLESRLAEVEEVPGTMLLGMFSLTLVVLGLSHFPTWSMAHIIEPAAKALVDQAGYIRAVMGGGL